MTRTTGQKHRDRRGAADVAPEAAGHDVPVRGRWRLSVRARILTAVLVTSALGMIGAGGVSYLIARQHTNDTIRQALAQENEEINTVVRLAEAGQSGRAITGPEDILYLAIKSSVPDPGEAILGMVNGRIALVPDSDEPTQKSVEADTELLAAATAVRPDTPGQVYVVSTPEHARVAYISIPVQVAGSDDLGHFVAAVDVEASFEPVLRTHLTYAAACLLALIAIGMVGHRVAGRLLSPLRSLQQTAQQISETDLSGRIPADQLAGRDEVAGLGHTVNAMLDRLDRSFDHQRRLLDDAGHELRTPITIVRGHLELMDTHDPCDVAETRDLALDELDRMQRLVGDLMMLAKSQRPDFVRPEPVAIAALLGSVRDLVGPLADRDWRIEDGSHGLVAALDPQRITQALVQLVSNAVRFTAADDQIVLGATLAGHTVRLFVRDTGAGIAPQDQERIFERFARADVGTHEGAGLGLAIVSAIAEAHHGSVEVSSAPGQGATFVLTLPVVDQRPTGDTTRTGVPLAQPVAP